MKRKAWRHVWWGVEFRSPRFTPHLLGDLWHKQGNIYRYEGEPPRAMLFRTRKIARAWCAAKMESHKGRTDACSNWRFRAVKVIETVRYA